jgi:hypothetical protein
MYSSQALQGARFCLVASVVRRRAARRNGGLCRSRAAIPCAGRNAPSISTARPPPDYRETDMVAATGFSTVGDGV